ncbi:hypothetical protein MIZ01_2194 [Sideroxyarcus emersonii]|uniref:Uncharacterized protein n=1 Tax=Sideroxyarcus emersonii TaxID=2764705 RepID=A0AAN2BZP1_9PROT|nr:hypothetical protein [Sideroxyarcus emersonii]BCK88390.1 hypothetical protein MIZ01_2194 [Sideroxyarcus emersonii]
MRKTAAGNAAVSEKTTPSIRSLLLTCGIGGALDYLCTFSVFSVLSAA